MDREVVVQKGVEPGAMPDSPNVIIHLDRDPNDPRIVRKPRLVKGLANIQGEPHRVAVIENKEKIMTFNKTVKTKDGLEKNVVASTQEELDEAVKVVKGEEAPTYPNIDVPVKKGHDLVEVQDDLSVELVDGTGAHNSPRDAVRDDGSPEGDTLVPGLPNEAAKKVPKRVRVGDVHSANLREQIGNEEVKKAEAKEDSSKK